MAKVYSFFHFSDMTDPNPDTLKPKPKRQRTVAPNQRPWPRITHNNRLPRLWTNEEDNQHEALSVHGSIELDSEASQLLWSKLTDEEKHGPDRTMHFSQHTDVRILTKLRMSDTPRGVTLTHTTHSGVVKRITMTGQWILRASSQQDSWSHHVKSARLNWSAEYTATWERRCRQFGATAAECVAGFMSYLHTFANKSVTLTPHDCRSAGAPVVEESETAHIHLLEDDSLKHLRVWYSKKFGEFVFSQHIRDGYVVHPNKDVLSKTILPLVIQVDRSMNLQRSSHRQLVIVQQLPDQDPGPDVIVLRDVLDLTHDTIRQSLKATRHVMVYVTAAIIDSLYYQCYEGKTDCTDRAAHKWMCQVSGYKTTLFDLHWDCVISCCDTWVVKVPKSHDIGFWWTLCTPGQVIGHDAPLSSTTITPKSAYKDTITLMNRHRMIDLTCIL